MGAACIGYSFSEGSKSLYTSQAPRLATATKWPLTGQSGHLRGMTRPPVHAAPQTSGLQPMPLQHPHMQALKTPESKMRGLLQSASMTSVWVAAAAALGMATACRFFKRAAKTDLAMATAMAVPQSGLYRTDYNVFQEFLASLKAILFFVTNFLVAAPLFVFGMLPLYPICRAFDPHVRRALDRVNWLWATLSSFLFYKVEVVNPENLPAEGVAAMYVANHQSWLDIFAMYSLNRSFKWVSKVSIFYIPITGWAMGLTGHVALRRTDRRSQMQVIKDCMFKMRNGVSMFFFPEGTRSKTGKVGKFQKGAFTIAKKLKTPIVPITVVGTGNIMQPGNEFKMYSHRPGVKLIVHPMIYPGEETTDVELMEQSYDVITASLPADCQ
uniref:1-acyl-sn-glycerol-3-phosphate acyltransferase n=1 Tax=Eutreptiella gymnastica TaxID=73025 RepID=A0A7S4FK38_9EUGL